VNGYAGIEPEPYLELREAVRFDGDTVYELVR
jgi:hypothetical protein